MPFKDLNPVRVVKRELNVTDYIIAIMGPTGAGKSSFIEAATGRDFGVGHSLQSHTSQLTAIRVKRGENYVVLVDTPGFDDTHLSDYDILKMISDWLRGTPTGSTKPLKLSGILYLHRISDNRMGGTTLKNLDMFQKLCGKDHFKRVILTTTMWPEDPSDLNDAKGRELELCEDYWKFMIDKGSRIESFNGTQESAWSILDSVKKEKQAVQIQKELNKSWKGIPDTAAGKQLHRLIGTMIGRQQVALRQLSDELGKTKDQEIKDVLIKEWLSLREEQEEAARDKQRLESRIGQKFISIFSGKKKRTTTQFPYEDRCLDLISDILKNEEQRRRIFTRSEDDTKIMYDFLCQISSREAFKKERTAPLLEDLKRRLKENYSTLHHENSQDGLSDKYENVYNILLDIIRNDATPTPSSDETRNADVPSFI